MYKVLRIKYKGIIFLIIGLFVYWIIGLLPAQAQVTQTPTSAPKTSITPVPSTSATPSIAPQINQLKERIASKVAQLKLVEKRGVTGVVTDTTDTQITIQDINGNTRYVDVDELTKFSSSTNKSFGISDVTKNMPITIIGLYNRESKRMLGRFVNGIDPQLVLTGVIASMDKTKYQLTMVDGMNKQYTIDIQNVTKTFTYTKAAGLAKSGFTKLEVGKRLTVVGTQSTTAGLISALRVIELPELTVNPTIKQSVLDGLANPTAATSPTSTPSSKLR